MYRWVAFLLITSIIIFHEAVFGGGFTSCSYLSNYELFVFKYGKSFVKLKIQLCNFELQHINSFLTHSDLAYPS